MDSYYGEIMFFAGNYAPENYMACQGQLLSISQYEALFSLLGTTYGGDGVSTFKLPDLQARIPVAFGAGPGLAHTYALGQAFGTVLLQLTTANIPAHTHAIMADSSGQPGQASPTGAFLTVAAETGPGTASCYLPAATTNLVAMGANTLEFDGGSNNPSPLDNRMPTMTLTAIMCVQGLYPVRP